MDEKTKKYRIESFLMILKSIKAQLGMLPISMNQNYLELMNITIFVEDIYKFTDPTSSQFCGCCTSKSLYGLWQSIPFRIIHFQKHSDLISLQQESFHEQ